MGLDRVEIERLIYDMPKAEWIKNWKSWMDHIDGADRNTGLVVREAIRSVYYEQSTRFGEVVVTKLVQRALWDKHLIILEKPMAKATYHGRQVNESALSCFVINERIVVTLSALFDTNHFNVGRCRSYLKALGLRWGIAADFGKTRAEIIGIRVGT